MALALRQAARFLARREIYRLNDPSRSDPAEGKGSVNSKSRFFVVERDHID
ncbi:MAG: hypothetical protein ABJE99_15510 [Roseobacter sp.]